MYFSLEPKSTRENLYNRDIELNELRKATESGRVILLSGIRRIGKTSLLQVFLEERKLKSDFYVFLDCRSFIKNNRIDKINFDIALLDNLEKVIKNKNINKIVKSISKISIPWIELSLKESDKKYIDIFQKLNDINEILNKLGKKLIIALDEAQNLRFYGRGGNSILNLLAHTYDHLHNIIFIITGSEVGLLHDFLKLDDPKSPMFGRYINEISLERFTHENSINFLIDGFKQTKTNLEKDEIEKAVDILDGIVGYLVIYGYIVCTEGKKGALEEAINMAEKLVKSEIDELVKRSENYEHLLKAVALGIESFSNIREYIKLHHGKITDQTLSNNISSLVKQCFLEYQYNEGSKLYKIPDPILKKLVLNL